MSLETEVAALTEATTELLVAVNVKKEALDTAVEQAEDASAAAVAAHVALPDPHTQYAKESELGTAASKNAPASGNASAEQVVLGSDTRLSDSRTPTAHTHTAANISDSTATGRALLTGAALSAPQKAEVRAGIGAGDFVNVKDYGAVGDGVADDTAAISSAITAGSTIFVPSGTYRLTSALTIAGSKRIFGNGEFSVLDVSYGGRAINVYGNNNSLESFCIKSSADLAITPQGVINCDNVVTATNNLYIDSLIFDSPNHGMNAFLIKGQTPSGLVKNVRIRNCTLKQVGRIGIEILGVVDGVDVSGNYINNTGLKNPSGYGMGVSISGEIKNSIVAGNTIGNCGNAAVEIVGAVGGCVVSNNSMFGTNGALISNTNATLANGLVIADNSSEPGFYSIVNISAAASPVITGNTFYCTRINLVCNGAQVCNNRIFSNQPSAVIIDNSARNRVIGNYIDNTASASNNAVIRCFQAGSTLNEIRNNFISKATGGSFTDENGGAASNLILDNRDATNIRNANIQKQTESFSTSSSNQYVRVLLGSTAIGGGNWRGLQFRIVTSGCENAGGNAVAGSMILFVRATNNSTTPVLISSFVAHTTNMSFTATMIAGGFHVQAIPATGSGQILTWHVENLSTGLGPACAPETLVTIVSAP